MKTHMSTGVAIAALESLRQKSSEIQQQITEVEEFLGTSSAAIPSAPKRWGRPPGSGNKNKRAKVVSKSNIGSGRSGRSEETKEKMRISQQKRWAKVRKEAAAKAKAKETAKEEKRANKEAKRARVSPIDSGAVASGEAAA